MKHKSLLLTLLLMLSSMVMAQVESGKVYRIVNGQYGTVVSASPIWNTLSCVTEGAATDYQQMWLITATENGKYIIQNVFSQKYLQNQESRETAFYTGTNQVEFTITENTSLPGYYNIDSGSTNWGMHCNSSGTVVPWSYGTDKVSASEWRFAEVSITEEEMAKAYEEYQAFAVINDNLGAIKEKAMTFFSDKAGTELKGEYAAMSDEELVAEMEGLPATLQNVILKIKNNSWDETTREKEFRVYEYKPYSDPVDWADKLYLRYYSRIDNPTGISSSSDREFLFIFVDEIPARTTVHLTEVNGTGFFGTDTKLVSGLNIVPSAMKDGVLYIRYVCRTDTATYELSDYPNLKVHIEGGYVNGFWSKERGHTNDDWAYMQKNMFKNPTAIQAKGKYSLLSFRKAEFLASCPTKITELINLWDFWNETQQRYMALNKYYRWFNNLQLAMSDDGGFMDAGNWRTHYNNNTLSTICNYDLLVADAGSTWGPNHEIGHNNQYTFEIVGTSEVSNNALANIVTFEQGTHTSRGNNLENQILDFENKVPYVLRGEGEYGSKLFSMTRMYFQLFLYAHAAGKCPDFYPRLFEKLRYDRLIGWQIRSSDELDENGFYKNSVNALHDQLKFAEACCEILQMDLSEFFESWGFFVPFKNGFVGDYGHHWVYLLEEDAKASKARMQKYEKKGGHLMFLEDRIRPSKRLDGNGYRQSYADWAGEKVGDVGDYGQWEDYIDESVKAEGYYYAVSKGMINIIEVEGAKGALGFKLYNGDTGELLTFTNRKSMKVPVAALNANLKVVAAQADGTDYVVPHASEGPEDLQLEALHNSYLAALQLKSRVANDSIEIGCYYPEALVELNALYSKAKAAYDNRDNSEHSYAEWSVMLDEECARIKSDPKNQVQFEENTTAYLTGAGSYRSYAMVWGTNGLVAKTSDNISNETAEKQWMVEYAGKEGEYHIKNGNGYYISDFAVNEVVQADVKSPIAAAKFNIVFENGRVIFPLADNPGITFGITGKRIDNELVLYGMSASDDNAQWKGFVIEDNSATHYKSELENALAEAKVLIREIINIDSLNTMNMFNSNIIVVDRNLEQYALNLYNKYNTVVEDMENAEMHKAYLTEFRKLFNQIEGTYKVNAPIVTEGEEVVWYRVYNRDSGMYISISSATSGTNANRLFMVSANNINDASLWGFASTGVPGEYKMYNNGKTGFVYEGSSNRLYVSNEEEPAIIKMTYDEANDAMLIMLGKKNFRETDSYADLNTRSKSYWVLEIADVENNKEIADIITVIEGVEADGVNNGNVYDMQGRKVTAPTKGIYIVNGKKVIVK